MAARRSTVEVPPETAPSEAGLGQAPARRLGFGVLSPKLTRRDAEALAKRLVEVRQVVEASPKGRGRDRVPRHREQPARPFQSQLTHIGAQRHSDTLVERTRETRILIRPSPTHLLAFSRLFSSITYKPRQHSGAIRDHAGGL